MPTKYQPLPSALILPTGVQIGSDPVTGITVIEGSLVSLAGTVSGAVLQSQTPVQSATAAGVAVAAGGYVTLVEIDTLYAGKFLNVEISNVGAGGTNAALNHFKIQLRDHVSGDWYDYLTDADFQSLVNPNVLFCTTVLPQTLAAGAQAHVHVRINAAASVRLQASVAAGTGTITTYASAVP